MLHLQVWLVILGTKERSGGSAFFADTLCPGEDLCDHVRVPGLAAWGALNGLLVFNGLADLPIVSLVLGLAGAAAVVSLSALLARSGWFRPLQYCGANSIVIYLAFFLPMALTRSVLLKSGWISDIGTISLVVTVAGVVGALCIYWGVRHTWFRFMFQRPQRFWLAPKPPIPLRTAQQA